MNIEEAKIFYQSYNGIPFHMAREDAYLYQQFLNLNIDKETLQLWDEDLLNDKLNLLSRDKENVWIIHDEICTILKRQNCDINKYANLILNEMDKMDELDETNRILIIENMAGRTAKMQDGLCYFICTYTNLQEKMNEVVNKISSIKAINTPDRFHQALKNYQKAYNQFKK